MKTYQHWKQMAKSEIAPRDYCRRQLKELTGLLESAISNAPNYSSSSNSDLYAVSGTLDYLFEVAADLGLFEQCETCREYHLDSEGTAFECGDCAEMSREIAESDRFEGY